MMLAAVALFAAFWLLPPRGASGGRRRPAGPTEDTDIPPEEENMRDDDVNHLHPAFQRTVDAILVDMATLGWPARVYETHRTAERQAQLKAAGRSKVSWSLHQGEDAEGNPAALAVDIIHAADGWANAAFFDALATVAEAHGATSGHRWKWRDSAHVQAVPVSAQRQIQAGADPVPYMGRA